MSDKEYSWENQSLAIEEAFQELKEPSMYKVLIINDDFTPMDFVVDVLVKFFKMTLDRATEVMMQVHTRGKGVCGIYSHEIAETKTNQVNSYAKKHKHPLLCVLEQV